MEFILERKTQQSHQKLAHADNYRVWIQLEYNGNLHFTVVFNLWQ